MGQIQTLEEFVGLLIRRRWLIGLVCGAGVLLSLVFGLSQGKTYQTGAVIQVESPAVADGSATVGGQSARLLQVIEQRLTTRESLTAMIERHGLFADAPGLTIDQKIAVLRKAVTFESVASVSQQAYGAPASVSALIITAQLADADQAARVANDFAQSILDQSSAGQTGRARETLAFYQAEEQRVGQEIVALEADLAAFKNRNAAALPGSRDTRRDELVALESDLRRLDQSLVAVSGERLAIEAKGQLRETDRRRLEDLLVQIGVLTAQKSALAAQRAALEAAMAQTPDIERELGSYDRRLQQLQSQYEVITARQAEAETGLRLEEAQHSEHFSLLERATVPETPVGGGGKKLAVLGSLASLLAAVGLAFLLDLLNPVLRTPGQMQRELDLRPVISIPEVKPVRHGPNPAERVKPLQSLPRYAALAGAVVLLVLVAANLT
ncbi:GumC domain-containing protein [Rhodobacter ferrooxidans]|uniref:Lipopolysaccharide biosynthesis protein n=1 Tax=Rhodobacter ferrooxidans TaxID=371731 RepID=C8RXI6_9RHOB|nr:lipopolysaccharide biosynthesis protein [Rhodobacter sp. SW2]EEW26711.1 lipopolysaccharide biosynthesis protein [Rhodobacter sp. SW2]